MSNTVTITSIVATNAALASSNARRAEEKRQCEHVLNTYQASTATVEQARMYSSCVSLLYPKPVELSSSETILVKVCILILLLAAAGGIKYGYDEEGILGACVGFFMGPLLVVLLLLGVGLVLTGFIFLGT